MIFLLPLLLAPLQTTVDQSATFTASAAAGASFQWQSRAPSGRAPGQGPGGFVDIEGATGATYTFTNAQLFDSGTEFRCVVTRAGSSIASASSELTVLTPSCGMAHVRCVGAGQEYATIQAAANDAQPGETVLVFDGTYAGFFAVNSGTVEKPIVFRAAGSNVIVNSRNGNTPDNINIEFSDESQGYIVVDGFTVLNSARAGIRSANAANIIIENNTIGSSAMWGILTGFTPRLQVLNNRTFNTAGQHGIYVSNSDVPNDDPVVRGNQSYNNAQNGIQFNGDCNTTDAAGLSDGIISGALIEGNTVHDNGYKGFSLIGLQSSIIENNLIYNNGIQGGAGGIHFAEEGGCNDPSSKNVVVNNTIVEPRIAAIRITNGTDNIIFNNIEVSSEPLVDETGGPNSVDISADLEAASVAGLFVNAAAGDYHLAARSPRPSAAAHFRSTTSRLRRSIFRGIVVTPTRLTSTAAPSNTI